MWTSVFVFFLLTFVGSSNSQGSKDDEPVDEVCSDAQVSEIVFMIDTSLTVGRKRYQDIQTFVINVIKKFTIDPEHVRVAVCSFSSRVRQDIQLNTYDNKDDLIEGIRNIRYIGGGTFTNRALRTVREQMLVKARDGVPRIIIVITDGLSRYPWKTKAEAEQTRAAGVKIVALGIGDAEQSEMEDIAGGAEGTAFIDSFDLLDSMVDSITKTTCIQIEQEAPDEETTTTVALTTLAPTSAPKPEDVDDTIYFLQREPVYVKKPVPLGVESGIIVNDAFDSLCNRIGFDAYHARLNGESGWIPCDGAPLNVVYVQIDLGAVVSLHGIATQGHSSRKCWVTSYSVAISLDGQKFDTLMNVNGTDIMVFTGNHDQLSTEYHCLHRMYNKTLDVRAVRFIVVTTADCAGLRLELYGFRDPNDPTQLSAIKDDVWTRTKKGCKCYWDPTSQDCACCEDGGCQCPFSNRHQCVQCGSPHNCGIPNPHHPDFNVDGWTRSMFGCPCDHNPLLTTCACCQNYGCQCGPPKLNQCVNCGHPEHCGQKEDIFGLI